MQTISIICATRNRLENMKTMWESAKKTAAYPEYLECVWYIDEDDLPSQKLAQEMGTKYLTLPRYSIPLSECIDKCYELTKKEILFGGGDDLVFHTYGWDIYVRDCFDRNNNLVLCGARDGLNNDIITHPIVHSKWVEILGYFCPPGYRDSYVDTFLNDVARMIGRLEWLPIYIEHRHYTKTGQMDQTSKERMALVGQNDESAQVFLRTKMNRIRDAEKLAKYI